MKRICIILSILHFSFSILTSSAAVPLRWTVETSRLQPVVFEVVRGETLDLEASFQSYGTPVSTSNMTAFLCWQTNGMASAWWVTNAVTSGNSASVLFTPSMDPGATTVNAFIGLSSTNCQPTTSYRAAITLRFRHGPGADPNVIDQPPRVLDLAHTVVVNPPWPTAQDFSATTAVMRAELKTYIDGEISGAGLVTPAATTNIAGHVVSNVVTKSFVEGLGIEAGVSTQDATNIAQKVIREDVRTNYLCTVEAAQAMTNAMEGVGTEFRIVRAEYNYNGYWDTVVGGAKQAESATTAETASHAGSSSKAATDYSGHVFEQYYAPKATTLSGYGITDAYTKTETYGSPEIEVKLEGKQDALDLSSEIVVGQIIVPFNSIIDYETTKRFTEYLKDGSWNTSSDPFAKVSEITSTNGFVTASVTNGLISAEAATNAAEAVFGSKGPSDIGAYPNTSGQQLAAQVSTQGAHLNAEDAQFVSTNYDSQVNLPEAYVRIKLQQGGTNVWRTIWEEMRRWNKFCGGGFDWQTWDGFHAWSTNIQAMIEETSPKEYAFFDGVTGDVAPDGFFWISQPRIGICAGASYQRHLDSGNAVWILESNGLTSNVGGTTNGYFRISDEEGNTQFEIIKGDKQTVPAVARSIRSESVLGVTHWFCDYSVTNAVSAPVAKFCRNLGANNPVWYDDTDASCPCNVTWTPGVNSYTLEFWPKSAEPIMFCKSEYDRGGETKIRQAVPTEMQYIILNGTKYGLVPKTVNGELVMGLTTGN